MAYKKKRSLFSSLCKSRLPNPLWDVGNNVKCFCCNKTVFSPCVHHRNGNHKDNRKENRIPVCISCHGFIHTPESNPRNSRGSHRHRSYNSLSGYVLEKITKLRDELNR